MNRDATNIANRLSLRAPQRQALEVLAKAADVIPMRKGAPEDLAAIQAAVKAVLPDLEDFERDFPSLCFALATGVGKTRLMGAFIAYLRATKGIRHFFVLAPGRTIYEKLMTDFSPGTPKYVLQGLSDFAVTPPRVITGDNYEQVAAAGHVGRAGAQQVFLVDQVEINVFNIDKLNKDSSERKGAPRIKRMREVLGESYFDYLASLDDLVLLMDESHHYRAAAGLKVLNELRPVLGLELTATPFLEKAGGRERFKNVVYSYPLHRALADGFIKEPAVATRKDFVATGLADEELERVKLEDAIHVHESTKVELDVHARQTGARRVKPFVLVIAQTIEHAEGLKALIAGDGFYGGRYRDKVIVVHGSQTGDEKEEVVTRLLKVEDADEPTEIVIHVNKLKEGWDVTNLYTIVPLRAASSKNLIEQSIGRGLRLPYGQRTGVEALDRLTIIAHDRFQELLDESGKTESIIRAGYTIGVDGPSVGQQVLAVPPRFEAQLFGATATVTDAGGAATPVGSASIASPPAEAQEPSAADVAAGELVAAGVRAVAQNPLLVPVIEALPKAHDQVGAWAKQHATPEQAALPGIAAAIERKLAPTIAAYTAGSIGIPEIVIQPVGDVRVRYRPFELDLKVVNFQPVEQAVLVNHLRDQSVRIELGIDEDGFREPRLENYILRGLNAKDDISYDDHAELLNTLAGRVIAHLRAYLPDDDAVGNVVRYYQRDLVRIVYQQLEAHHEISAAGFRATAIKGVQSFGALYFAMPAGAKVLPYRAPVADLASVKSSYFDGFKKCLYQIQQFDSDSERRLAVILEDDPGVLRWLKPERGRRIFHIYLTSREAYYPDFAVETAAEKLVVEVKRADQLDHPLVQEKAQAAVEWCGHATAHELKYGGKPWRYVLIPHDAITSQMTVAALVARYGQS